MFFLRLGVPPGLGMLVMIMCIVCGYDASSDWVEDPAGVVCWECWGSLNSFEPPEGLRG